jgi:hypothetical protein
LLEGADLAVLEAAASDGHDHERTARQGLGRRGPAEAANGWILACEKSVHVGLSQPALAPVRGHDHDGLARSPCPGRVVYRLLSCRPIASGYSATTGGGRGSLPLSPRYSS